MATHTATPGPLEYGSMNPTMLFGVIFDLLLFGILTAQVYIYYISFPKDRILLKYAIIWVYLAGVVQTGFAIFDLNISSTEVLKSFETGSLYLKRDHLWLSITALTGAVAIVIQSLYAHRIYLISERRWLAVMIMCMSWFQFANSIFGAACYRQIESPPMVIYLSLRGPNLLRQPTCIVGFAWIWGPVNIICDLLITVCMVTFLLGHRRRIIRPQTRSHVTKVIQIVVETGMATTVLMTIYTVLFIGWNNLSYLAFFPLPGLMMSKVYSNSMLALLNNRATIVNGRNTMESFEFVEVSARNLERDIELHTRNRNSTVSM